VLRSASRTEGEHEAAGFVHARLRPGGQHRGDDLAHLRLAPGDARRADEARKAAGDGAMCIPAGPASDTVRVEEGLLKIRYDKWTAFNGEFGHIFYGTPSSYYRLVAEYRFMGEQLTGGAGWAMRNNGLMLHAPDPKTMLLDQDFPISLEMQLLGGLGDGKPRTTANLCTRGTHVVMTRALVAADCVNSTSKTYDGDQWVRVEVEVLGGERIRHVVDGQTVLEYSKPQIGGGNVNAADPAVKVDGTPLTGGFIAVQAETAPIDFRKLELLNLEGCMDPKASNYKSYFVKSNPAACRR